MYPKVPSSETNCTPKRGWRLIFDGARGAAENMAIDEAILRACADGLVLPTIRIYSWQRPSISLGCLQDITAKFNLDYCRESSIDVVRRITGGRAVMHGSDVTFSIAVTESDMPSGCSSVLASHQWLMGGMVAGLQLLGMDAEIGPSHASRPSLHDADCFAHIAECDVRIGRAKAVGSAQVRKYGALLEQGSIPFCPPKFDADRVFGQAPRTSNYSLDGFSFETIAKAIVLGFGNYMQTSLKPENLTNNEIKIARDLAQKKYATSEWTISRKQ